MSATSPASSPAAVTGVQLAKGIGVQPAKGFWADAWSQVVKRPAAVTALVWLAIVAFFGVFGPVLASGHPLWMTVTNADGSEQSFSPLWRNLRSLDMILLALAIIGLPYVLVAGRLGAGTDPTDPLTPRADGTPGRFVPTPAQVRAKARAARLRDFLIGLLLAIAVLAIAGVVQGRLEEAARQAARAALSADIAAGMQDTDAPVAARHFARRPHAGFVVGGIVALLVGIGGMLIPFAPIGRRLAVVAVACIIAAGAIGMRWNPPLERFDYPRRELLGEVTARYTLIPWSPSQRFSDLSRLQPMTTFGAARAMDPPDSDSRPARRVFIMGTDAFGADVLSQILHACRLSISIGVVSTMIALIIGVTMGAIMGYFGGWVDLLLYRVVEIFMAVPVLFLLIVAVAVLPDEFKTTYVIMAIIGCFTWTGMARFTRAEFLKLRNQDFVQSAQAAGLPLRSILFKHMLPNGVAPVLVDTSFAVAAAISIEAVLSYLGLGPVDSPSWGKLLSSAISSEGEFKWWLAVFPGGAIFLTVLAYNLIGEALRDAIDPKLKKARV
ncbi:MAG: ABC transporter permease [Phycisphaeraceae bacterium]|nr:ABC transporter permease [Phycisphaeraceae bacterium]